MVRLIPALVLAALLLGAPPVRADEVAPPAASESHGRLFLGHGLWSINGLGLGLEMEYQMARRHSAALAIGWGSGESSGRLQEQSTTRLRAGWRFFLVGTSKAGLYLGAWLIREAVSGLDDLIAGPPLKVTGTRWAVAPMVGARISAGPFFIGPWVGLGPSWVELEATCCDGQTSTEQRREWMTLGGVTLGFHFAFPR